MAVEVKIPSLGESISEVVLSKWHKSSGDWVDKDEAIYEIESDKITTDVPSTDAGVITVVASEGAELPIGAVVATIDQSGKPKPGNAKIAAAPAPQSGAEPNGATSSPVRATSVARKIAEEKGVPLGSIPGTGPAGRVTKSDVLTATTAPVGAKPAPIPASPRPAGAPIPTGTRGERREKMTKLRERIAERLLHSKQSTAMLTTFNEADMTNVMAIRAKYKDAFEKKHGVGLGIMSFFVKAACSALAKYPRINAFIDGDSIIYHDYIDVSIAVSTDKGLTVPVVRDAHRLSFADVESSIRDLAARARDGKLTIDELQGGTFTITNGGVFGSLMATPILNPPQSAILGMHAIKNRPVEDPDHPGQIALRPMMYVALSYDHRIVDGAESVGFLVHVKQCIENPERMMFEV